ncbi:hypothetical protein HJC23_004055 [Cyclotella cryptica]|uniref:Phospholipid scramblase n=1 Tax=Cyclotella cryptica TaxID=29204 RepID=A0ABD3QUQ1_9STRA|eukprot:CCRYP_002061-RB/>CCRYP_002061-RB protein AED:0.04 eAED:0.04 QI:485/1/1/1/0/0/5/1951/182
MMKEDSIKTVESEHVTMNAAREVKGAKIFSAMLCCYTAFDFEDPALCGRQKSDCLCINTRACMDLSADSLGVGCLTGDKKAENEFFRIGAYCCTCALAMPELKCNGIEQRFCMKSVKSFPFDKNYVAKPTCACCFLQCFPVVGCCQDAPECPAEEDLRLVGNGVITTHSLARDMIRSHKMHR